MTVEYRSFSQWSDMTTCPYSYQLKRIDRVDQIQAAWTAQGVAIHQTLETWEKDERRFTLDELTDMVQTVYDQEINKAKDKEPNLSQWFSSGPYNADTDIPRRRGLCVDAITKTVAWYDNHPDEVPWKHPDGRLGVEIEFTLVLDSVTVRGVVDWYGRIGPTDLGPRDYKSGRNPGKHMQLKLYDLAMDDHFAWRKEQRVDGGIGDFFMTRTGKPTVPYNLEQITRDDVENEFWQIDNEILAGDFPALPKSDNCKFCSVRRACKYRAV